EERGLAEVERDPYQGIQPRPEFFVATVRRNGAQIFRRKQFHRDPVVDPLEGFSIDRIDRRSQHLVSADDVVEGALKRALVDASTKAMCRRRVVDGPPRVETLEKPEPLLHE